MTGLVSPSNPPASQRTPPQVSHADAAQSPSAPHSEARGDRVLVRARGEQPGPAFLAVGSLHGNEPSGLLAIQEVARVLSTVQADRGTPLLRGDFLGLAGNLVALEQKKRFIDHDLNRGWSMDRLARVERDGADNVEDAQMLELFGLVKEFRDEARGPMNFVDLHSTSGESPPFASVADLGPDRDLVSAIPVPTVLGIDRHLKGTFLECMQQFDFTGIVFEGGQHDDPLAVDHNEAALWLVLEKLGMIDRSVAPVIAGRLTWAHDVLEPIGARYPEMLRIEYRYALESTEDFTMCSGFESFQVVSKGQLLAQHRGEEVRSDRDGRILMPLYQPQGDEGFFLMEELQTPDTRRS